jgi:ribosomal protein L11 methyltransferase
VIRLAVRVRREHADVVLAELLDLAPAGVEERELDAATVEYAVYGPPGELPSMPALHAAAGDALVEISSSETADDWQERWREFHRPVLVAPPAASTDRVRAVPGFHLRPPWEPAAQHSHARVEEIVIDPGQAFGTGAHATTRQCLELLLALAQSDAQLGALVDVGTGSGVLAIAAARLGFSPVLAIDNERESVAAARDNAAVNGVSIDVRLVDLRAGRPLFDASGAAGGGAPRVVLANLLAPLLVDLAAALTHPPAHLIAGGLLAEQRGDVARAFGERLGLHERERREDSGWAAVWLCR